MASVKYSELSHQVTESYSQRARKVEGMKAVANALVTEAVKQMEIPQGRCRIGALDSKGDFHMYQWEMMPDGGIRFALEVDYVNSNGDVVSQQYARFEMHEDNNEVVLKSLETGGGGRVPYLPIVMDEHVRIAANLVATGLQMAAIRYKP